MTLDESHVETGFFLPRVRSAIKARFGGAGCDPIFMMLSLDMTCAECTRPDSWFYVIPRSECATTDPEQVPSEIVDLQLEISITATLDKGAQCLGATRSQFGENGKTDNVS
jgi:hypothetical protein